jgi:rubredoxin
VGGGSGCRPGEIPVKIWICRDCGQLYDEAIGMPEAGIPAGTAFADLPEDWVCPVCGSPKAEFEVEDG